MNRLVQRFIPLIISCLSLTAAHAQHSNSFAGIRFGGALPMGQFASHAYGTGGYALLGKSFGGEAAWFINPRIGFGVDVSMNSFNFASGYYAEDYQQHEPSFSSVNLLSSPYEVSTFMAGAYYKISICPRLNSTFKLMAGMVQAKSPNQLYGVDAYMVGKITFWKTSSLDRNIGMLAGASLEYKLYDKVTLLVQADFSYAEMAFKFNQGSSTYTSFMQMPVFKLQPGINIHF